jgi:hypothetical protein
VKVEKRKRTTRSAAADAASDNAQAEALDSAIGSEVTEVEQTELLANAASVAPSADGSVEIAPDAAAVLAEALEVQALESTLAALPEASGARGAVEALLVDARARLAAAEAAQAAEAAHDAELTQARAAALQFNLPAHALDAMLAAIDAKYAPVADVVADAPAEAESASAAKTVGVRRAAINAEVAADAAALTVGAADWQAWKSSPDFLDYCAPQRTSGTRYPTFIPLASTGSGVSNYAELERRVSAVRTHMRTVLGIGGIGNGTGTADWLARRGKLHSPSGSKSNEYAALCFTSRASVALYPDGKFRLAAHDEDMPVRFISIDDGAFALFKGGTDTGDNVRSAAAQALNAAEAAAKQAQRSAPTPPTAEQTAAAMAQARSKPANCQHCGKRNVIGDAKCSDCQSEDWLAE